MSEQYSERAAAYFDGYRDAKQDGDGTSFDTEAEPEPHVLVMASALFWEPIFRKTTATEFRCLVLRVLSRLEHGGYELRRIDGSADA